MSGPRVVRSPRGTELSCANWQIEAPYRMLQNNLDPEVAERPDDLVVYGGTGRAARSWDAFDAMRQCLCSPANLSVCFARTSGRPEYCSRTRISSAIGQLGTSSDDSRTWA